MTNVEPNIIITNFKSISFGLPCMFVHRIKLLPFSVAWPGMTAITTTMDASSDQTTHTAPSDQPFVVYLFFMKQSIPFKTVLVHLLDMQGLNHTWKSIKHSPLLYFKKLIEKVNESGDGCSIWTTRRQMNNSV